MIRILFASLLGGLTTLLILSSTGSTRFLSWTSGFGIAVAILLPLMLVGLVFKNSANRRLLHKQAKESGSIRTALILARKQTGMYVNEQPQVEFTLLVDRFGERPFQTTARSIVSLLDTHRIAPGELIAVAHPDPEHGDVYPLVGDSPPRPSQSLTAEAASTAAELPRSKRSGASPAFLVALVSAFLVGAVGAPFLATPNPLLYVQHVLSGHEGSVSRIDHPFLFEADELERSLKAMVSELGQDQVLSIRVFDTRLQAMVRESPDSLRIDRVTVQDHQITNRESHGSLPRKSLEEHWSGLFNVFDVDWQAVLERMPEAAEFVKAQGFSNPELISISAQPGESALAPIEIRVDFRDDDRFTDVFLAADGEIAVNERFALLSAADRATFFHDAENFHAAVQEMLDAVGSEEIIEVGNYGDRLYVEAFIATDSGVGTGQSVRLAHREGRIADIDAPTSTKVGPDERFDLEDLDWVRVYQGIATGQQIMADAGADNTKATHILIQRDDTHSRTGNETYARIYLRNALNEGGYVVVYGDGSIGRVTAP